MCRHRRETSCGFLASVAYSIIMNAWRDQKRTRTRAVKMRGNRLENQRKGIGHYTGFWRFEGRWLCPSIFSGKKVCVLAFWEKKVAFFDFSGLEPGKESVCPSVYNLPSQAATIGHYNSVSWRFFVYFSPRPDQGKVSSFTSDGTLSTL